MKKIFTILSLAIALMAANVANAQVNIHGGFVASNTVTTTTVLGFSSSDTVTMPGFYVGGDYNINLFGHLGVSFGANVEYLTDTKTVDILGMAGVDAKSTQTNLSIPVTLNYGLHLSPTAHLTFFVGPEAFFGIKNQTAYHGTLLGLSKDWTTDWYNNDDPQTEDYYTERFSWGLHFGGSLNFDQVGIHIGFTRMMNDVYSSDNVVGESYRANIGLNINF